MTQEFSAALLKSAAVAGESVHRFRSDDSLVFLLFSDLHMKTVESDEVEKLLMALKAADLEISPDLVINLGDNPGMLGREQHITNDNLAGLLTRLFDNMQSAVNCPMLLIHGNHDAPGTDFHKPDFWNEIIKGRYGHDKAVYGPEGSYCYLDISTVKTRFVILSMPYESDIDSLIPSPCWKFGDEQLRWLANDALNTEYSVILLSHVPFFYEYRGNRESMLDVWTGERTAKSYIKDLCGEIADREIAVAILSAFQKHEEYRDDTLGICLKASPFTASLAACFSGHTHKDALLQSEEVMDKNTNPLPCTQVVTKTATIFYGDEPHMGISLDAIVWSPSERSFHIFRIGDGENRSFSV